MSASNTLRAVCAVVLSFTIAGCASLETAADHTRDFAARHPLATAVGAAIVVGGAVYALEAGHHHGESNPVVGPKRPGGCGYGPC